MRSKIGFLIIGLVFLVSVKNYAVPKVIGYLPTWSGYPNSINSVDLTKVTHINIAFANPNSSGDLSTSSGTLANLATVVTAAHAQGVQVLMSIGGAGAPGTTYKNLIVADLSGFVAKIVQYAVDNNLDGIDVDLEGDVLNGSTMTSTQYENFVTALGVGLHAQGKIMTAALATWFANRVTNTAASKFDFINIMSYDAYGTWTGPGQHAPYSLAVSDLNYWHTTKGVPSAQLTVGVPFYGYFWGNSNTSYTFSQIVNYYPGSENKDKFIPATGGVIYYNGIPTIKQKTVLGITQAGGVMIWQLTGDATGTNSLLNAIDEVVQGYAGNVAPTVAITAPSASTVYAEGDTVQIDITTSDSDGNIMKVEYYAGTYKIGEFYSAPYTIKWVGAAAGSYSLTAVTTDNIGATVTSAAVSITVTASASSAPFSGTAISIPGKIEIENYNLGNNTIGYYDLTSTNLGGVYRTGRVDIEECVDAGGGYDVGWTDPAEWMEYSVNITASDKYDFQMRVATDNISGTFHIEIDGVNVTGTITVPNTGGWQTWQTVTVSKVKLHQGVRKMRIVMEDGGFNFNYINTVALTTATLDELPYEERTVLSPNPVSQTSLLHFYLHQTGKTKIVLYNDLGHEVAVLANDYRTVGENEILIQRENFPKGIYLCRIFSDAEEIVLKVIMD
jgi:chitinase